MDLSGLPVTAVTREPSAELDTSAWPATLPCVRQVLDDGLQLGPLTILVGENGSGKSTLIEAIAQRFGLSPEGGSTGARHSTRPSESPLWRALRLRRGLAASKWGFFLRAETDDGLAERTWGDLDLVANWTAFLDDPDLYLRHLID